MRRFVEATGIPFFTTPQGRGVVPDEAVPTTREALLGGHDRPLEAALAWIDRAGDQRRKGR
jgi:thiamine pyrophosphate-dependent acetolactate synthase large subunit-like protein